MFLQRSQSGFVIEPSHIYFAHGCVEWSEAFLIIGCQIIVGMRLFHAVKRERGKRKHASEPLGFERLCFLALGAQPQVCYHFVRAVTMLHVVAKHLYRLAVKSGKGVVCMGFQRVCVGRQREIVGIFCQRVFLFCAVRPLVIYVEQQAVYRVVEQRMQHGIRHFLRHGSSLLACVGLAYQLISFLAKHRPHGVVHLLPRFIGGVEEVEQTAFKTQRFDDAFGHRLPPVGILAET